MTPEEKIIVKIEALLDRMKKNYDLVSRKYPVGDLRPTFLAAPGNTIRSYHLYFCMIIDTITRVEWWRASFGKEPYNDLDRGAIKNLETFSRFSFFIYFLSQIEWSMRKLVTHISPGACKNGSASFESIHKFIFSSLNLSKYNDLYDLCRTVRNGVHTNGSYTDSKGIDKDVNWKGVTYSFRHLQPVEFLTYDLIFELYNDLCDSLDEVLKHPTVASPSFMEDKRL